MSRPAVQWDPGHWARRNAPRVLLRVLARLCQFVPDDAELHVMGTSKQRVLPPSLGGVQGRGANICLCCRLRLRMRVLAL